jgi:basic membrane protein A
VDEIRVAWVNQGASGEDPWTLAQFQAMDEVERAFAGRVRASFVEKVELGEGVTGAVDRLVDDGCTLVIAPSAPLGADIRRAAATHPEVRFEQARSRKLSRNISTYTGTHEQSSYLTGLAAGSVSVVGRIGYVAPVFEVETLRILNGFALGVQATLPGAVVLVSWVDSWWDPDAERSAGEFLLDAGVDVIATGCTSPATGELAREVALPWCSQDADRSHEFSDVWVTAPRILPGAHYKRRVADVLTDSWWSQKYIGGLADGFTDIAPIGLVVPDGARQMVMRIRNRIRSGGRIPRLGFPFGSDPVARPTRMVAPEVWAASTHVPGIEVIEMPLPTGPEPTGEPEDPG